MALEREAQSFSHNNGHLAPDKRRELQRIQDRIRELREQLGMISGS